MKLLQKLPDSRRSPPGLEWRILKKLPAAALASTVVPLLCYAIAYLLPSLAGDRSIERYLTDVAIAAIAAAVTAWTAIFTLALGCFIVVLMKGPGYVADRYPLIDADEPARGPRRESGERDID
jgi:hypothetical protein